ncbi:helix-turn-helix DNA-binding domain protein [Mycobacterium phage Steamy]|uniref:Helix-turn-helix DNA-binding domain protein n=1 Tax=Mycobacterium phage Steamy TaxID=2250309 RepID=A0A345L0L6_9CAUD|nr:HTH DNA binding protein [Mycobacterium phage Steamy]AXH48818.1 helix-turn-helix DNA-binding domain protein [Mycobacterium phage Steamy]
MELTEIVEAVKGIADENVRLREEAVAYANQNVSLHAQLATAKRAFGEAFTKGYRGPTGAERPNRPKLSEQDAKDIRAAYRGGMKQADLARNYGVNPATISRLVRYIYH